MKQENQNGKPTFNFVRVDGFGTVAIQNGYCDVFVYGYFTMWDRWKFFVHADVDDPSLITVSEASTGFSLKKECYYTVEAALYYALPFIREKRFYFSTTVGNVLRRTMTELSSRNTTNLQTAAIDTLLWL